MDKVKSALMWLALLLVIGIGAGVLSNAVLLPDSAWREINKMYVNTVTTTDRELTLNIVRTVSRPLPVEMTVSIYEQENGEVPRFDFSDKSVMRKGTLAYSQAIPVDQELEAGSYIAEVYIEFAVGFSIRRDVIASTSFVVVAAKDV